MGKKKGRNDGKLLEEQSLSFFSKIFERLGFLILKERLQHGGTQDGFDILFTISDELTSRNIFIECKDYKSDINFGNIYAKLHDLESNYDLSSENDIAIFISPRSNFGNNRNPEKSEPVLNTKYPFKVCLFELSNKIDRLFAVERDIYENIYNETLAFDVDSEVELDRFKRTLFSKTGIKAPKISEFQKRKYLSEIKSLDFHITRGVTLSQDPETDDRQLFNILNKVSGLFGISDILEKLLINPLCPGLVLLGNPGMGKSSELKKLAIDLWNTRKKSHWIPIYRQVNLFLEDNKIEELLPNDWESIPQLLIILDGLDEISFASKFRTKLEQFIQQDSGKNQIKFIISCRTNIYDILIKDITNFKCCVLNNLDFSSALRYLNEKYEMPTDAEFYSSISQSQKEFFENPYYLNLLGEYYTLNKKLPTNKSELMEQYIIKRIKDDRREHNKAKDYDGGKVLHLCKKVSLAMEAMQTKKINEEKLSLLLDSDKKIFTESCFVFKVYGEDNWEFEHRNLQEFFVAKSLSKLSFEAIIDFIKIDENTNKTHPSWLNSISYLINLLNKQSDKAVQLFKWLQDNDMEVLFKADRTRIDDTLRTKVFQRFFNKKCKEQTLWIGKYDSETKELVRFGNSISNWNFLITELKDDKNHRRTRISAMGLASQMTLSSGRKHLKEVLLRQLSKPISKVDIGFKWDILHSILHLGFYKEKGVVATIIKSIGHIDDHRIHSGILTLINNENPNDHFGYIKAVSEIVILGKERKYPKKDNLISGEERMLKGALLKLKGKKNLMFSLNLFGKNKYRFRLDKDDVEKLIKEMVQEYKVDKSVFKAMIDFVIDGFGSRLNLYKITDVLASFFKDTQTEVEAFKCIYESKLKFSNMTHFLVQVTKWENVLFVLQEFLLENIKEEEVLQFRNVLSYVNRDLSIRLQRLFIEETDYRFNEDLLDIDIRKGWNQFHDTKDQLSFNLLFNRKLLHEITEDYFKCLGKSEIGWEDIDEGREEFWESLELQQRFLPSFIEIVDDTLRPSHVNIEPKDVKSNINNDIYILYRIKKDLTDQNKNKIKEKPAHKEWITKWCFENLSSANFYKGFENDGKRNDLVCEYLYYFRRRYDLRYPKEVLLDMLMVDYYKEKGGFIGYDYIIDQVGNKKVSERIIKNLNNGIQIHHIFESHVIYALEHNLEEVFPIIKNHILDMNIEKYRRLEILKKYIEKTNDKELLKELITLRNYDELERDISWDAIQLLITLDDTAFVIEKLLEFREIEEKNKKELNVLKYLLRAGYDKALRLFNKWLLDNSYDRKAHRAFATEDFVNFFHPTAIVDVAELIKISHTRKIDFDHFFDPIRTVYEILKVFNNRATSGDIFHSIEVFEDLKGELAKMENVDLFHINSILNESWGAYFKKKSRPMTFGDIALRIEGLKYEL